MSRFILLGLVLIISVGAFFLWVTGNGDPVEDTSAVEVPNQMVGVLVASRDISRGDRLASRLVKWIEWPVDAVPPDYITEDNTEFFEKIDTALARSDILKGEPIFESRLVRPGGSGVLSALLAPGMRAMTLSVDVANGGGGFVLPGDAVDLYFTRRSGDGATPARLLYEDLRVLAIDQNTTVKKNVGTLKARTVTLEVAPSQVQPIIAANEAGEPTFILRSVFQPEPGDPLLNEFQARDVVIIRYGQAQAL